MLRLFKIEFHGDPFYFNNKRLAKVERDALRAEGYASCVVMRGPDHYKGESFNISKQASKVQRNRGW